MKDQLNYIMSFVGRRIVFDVGWHDYRTGVIKSVEVTGRRYDYKVKFVVDNILSHDDTFHEGRKLEFISGVRVLLENYLNYHHQRWGMWALADSKAGNDLVHRIERTWDRKPEPEYNPYCDPKLLEKKHAKYYNLVKHHRNVDYLPIWVRTKYRDDSTQYRLEKVEPLDYEVWIVRNKAFVVFKNVAYAHKVKVTNLGRKFFFTEEEGLKSLE